MTECVSEFSYITNNVSPKITFSLQFCAKVCKTSNEDDWLQRVESISCKSIHERRGKLLED